MTYLEILNKSTISKHIPLSFEGRTLPKGFSSAVILLKVQYDKHVEEFNSLMQKIADELKKEGYDERFEKIKKMNDVYERLKKVENGEEAKQPTEQELKEAEETKLIELDFKRETDELNEEYTKAYMEHIKTDITINERKFSREEFDEVVELIGVDGNIEINGKQITKEQFINTIGLMFVQ